MIKSLYHTQTVTSIVKWSQTLSLLAEYSCKRRRFPLVAFDGGLSDSSELWALTGGIEISKPA